MPKRKLIELQDPALEIKKPIHIFALYNKKKDGFIKKRTLIIEERRKRRNGEEWTFWTKYLKYARLFSRRSDCNLCVKAMTRGWNPEFTENDFLIIPIKLEIENIDFIGEKAKGL